MNEVEMERGLKVLANRRRLAILNLQFQFAEVRSRLKKRGALEALISITMLIAGLLALGHAILG